MDTYVMCYIIRIALHLTNYFITQRVATLVVLLLLIVNVLCTHSSHIPTDIVPTTTYAAYPRDLSTAVIRDIRSNSQFCDNSPEYHMHILWLLNQ